MNFREFVEMTSAADEPIDDIKIKPEGRDRWTYMFDIEGEQYMVDFESVAVYADAKQAGFSRSQSLLTNKAIEISLKGPDGYMPTGIGKPTLVYTAMIKAVRKAVEELKPDGLRFAGATAGQDVMYARFYNQFLKPHFTRISNEGYIRNDLLEAWKNTDDPRWAMAAASMRELEQSDPLGKARSEKLALRQKSLALRAAVGKIAYNKDNHQPSYVQNVSMGGMVNVLWSSTYNNQILPDTVQPSALIPFDPRTMAPADPTYAVHAKNIRPAVAAFVAKLQQEKGITATIWH